MFTTNVLEASTEPFNVKHYQVNVVFLIFVRFVVTIAIVGIIYVVVFYFSLLRSQVG